MRVAISDGILAVGAAEGEGPEVSHIVPEGDQYVHCLATVLAFE